ncbi:glycosyltransferase family 31 protein [Hypoxylon trugodes]|uniref:glycosyltransferase family 31 protein n=1 Tax=Hypoxylon trugodes TaxID=326681 RepID=UPI002193F9AD|nr:glycosyltransferase family 31 protein [Hypoxylon trugodes]KAI1389080.1 glycosyltransferase family 31 protein [Hypoxylon trugodes]
MLSRPISRNFTIIWVFILALLYLLFCRSSSISGNYFQGNFQPSCDSLSGLEDLFVILRTGATEAPKKLPVHFATTLRCVPHYVIYSDYEEDIEGHHVYNSLDEVNPDIIASHPDFEYYRRLQAGGREAFTAEEIAQWAAVKNTNSGRDSPGWKLDKWKFLPVAEKAFAQRPDAKWYIFIESDTYMLWQTLLEWLSKFDSSKPHYLGMQMQIGDVVFAYGGGGFAISNPAMQKVVAQRQANLKLYDDFTAVHWAGDCVLGKALADAGMGLLWSFPTLAGDQPGDIDFNSTFGGQDKKPWCYYATSYHHMQPAEYTRFMKFEEAWNQKNTFRLRHRDVFRHYILPQLSPERVDWDNLSENDQGPIASFEECRKACENQRDCVQFSLSGNSCKTSATPKLGNHVSENSEESVRCGWILERVEDYAQSMDEYCSHQTWILP